MFCLLALFALAQTSTALDPSHRLVLNEFCAVNSTTLLDEDGEASDWIEIHNSSAAAVNLAGWALTDDPALPAKWLFPARVLAPHGYLIVFASDKDRAGAGELHTNFKLSGSGEYLALMRPGGALEHAYSPAFPAQLEDVSYGLTLTPSGGRSGAGRALEGYFVRPTPGGPNGEAGFPVAPVEFSVPRGFQSSPFSLQLSCPTAGTSIRYTLDGSDPMLPGATAYGGPIAISGTTVVRAIALVSIGPSITHSVTSTYLFADQIAQQTHLGALAAGFPAQWVDRNGADWTVGNTRPGAWYGLDTTVTGLYTPQQLADSLQSIPSLSLCMSLEDWFGYDPAGGRFGIYPNSLQEGAAWTRAGSMEFIDPGGGPEVQVNCDLAIQGGSSTDTTNRSQLSIALKFRSRTGPSKLEFPMFPGSPVERFDYLLLDGGNQNSIHGNVTVATKRHAQGTRDQFMMDMQRAMGGQGTYGRHVHLYLNGLYWGVYDLHERPDQRWASERFGGDDAEYDFVKEGGVLFGNNNPASDPFAPGVWPIIRDIAHNGLDEADLYHGRPAYEALQDYLDLDDYIDYLLLNFWAQNFDWPQRNWMATGHARNSADLADFNTAVQFRLHSWDAELTLGWEGITVVGDMFYDRTQLRTDFDGSAIQLYTALLEHAEFAVRVGDRAQAHLGPGGALHVDPAYSTLGTPYDPAFPERNAPATTYYRLAQPLAQALIMEYARWGNYFHTPGAVKPQDWETERLRILREFCAVRSNVLLAQLRNGGLYPLLDPPQFSRQGGPVPAGFDLALSGPPSATIYYTIDGSDPRLEGGAVAPGASVYSLPIDITQRTTVNARARSGQDWSALVSASFPIDYDLVINEVLADNDTVYTDEFGEFEDVIELYNAGTLSVDLGGMYLTDDLSDTRRWEIPAGVLLPPGGTLVFFADDEELEGPLHTSFSLSRFGEEVGLFHDDASGNFELDRVVFGPQVQDLSLGCLPDGGSRRFTLLQPSPGARNVPVPGATRAYDALDPALNPAELLLASGAPLTGQTPIFSLQGAPPGSSGTFVVGTGPLAVPVGGGWLLARNDVAVLPLTTDGLGSAQIGLPIPAQPALVGLTLYTQALAGSTFSNALALTIGP